MTVLKLRTLATFAIIATITSLSFAGNPSYLYWNLDQCESNFNTGSNESFEEFVPELFNSHGCTQLEMINPTLYRNDPSNNGHSCTMGYDGFPAMCINSWAGCFYAPNRKEALRFDVMVHPDVTGTGRLSTLEFYELAPEQFSYLNGISGPNNYPTKYAIRVLANGEEIYRQIDIPTTQDWTLETFDFSSNPAFVVNSSTAFHFEILPYCFIGNGYGVQAWDIDDIKLTSNCGDGITEGGYLTTYQGDESIDLCISGLSGNQVSFTANGALGQQFQYIVTSPDGTILGLPGASSTIDFTDAGPGTCLVWNLAFEGSLLNLAVGNNIFDIDGCFDLSNAVEVNRQMAIPATISSNGLTDITICNITDAQTVEVQVSGSFEAFDYWVVTNTNNDIISINAGPPFDFTGVQGTCLIYYITSSLSGTPDVGTNLMNAPGCMGVSNPITVKKFDVQQSTIVGTNGETSFPLCEGGSSMLDIVVTGGNGAFIWMITDLDGFVIEVQPSLPIDLSQVNLDACLVYLARTAGNLGNYVIGGNVDLITGCFELSNPITVFKSDVTPSVIDINGQGATTLCLSNTSELSVTVNSNGGDGESSTFVLTDESGNIITTQNSNNFDFSTAGPGTCIIYEVVYEGALMGLVAGQNIGALDGCYALSNGLIIYRDNVSGGTIATPDGTTSYSFCGLATGNATLTPSLTGNSGSTSYWVITDPANNIIGLTQTLPINFAGLDVDNCFVYHYSASGTNNLSVGVNLSALTGCYGLSNPIAVSKENVAAGNISIDGQTSMTICEGDGIGAFNVQTTATTGDILYLVTDVSGNIISTHLSPVFDLSGNTQSTCVIWQLASTGTVTGAGTGQNVSGISGCYQLSNSITITKINVQGGTLSTPNQVVCLSDDNSNVLSFSIAGNVGAQSNYVLTNAGGTILAFSTSPSIDFNLYGVGTYAVYHVASSGSIGLEVGQSITGLTGCHDVSNGLSIVISDVEAGTISSPQGDNISVCVGDGVDDLVDVSVAGNSGANGAWVITDASGNILELPAGPPFNFDGAGLGTCLIWFLSYEDGLGGAAVGQNASNLTGCYDLSNPITVTRTTAEAGTIALSDGSVSTSICAGDGVADPLNVNLTGNSGDFSQWVVTDAAGNILDLPAGPPFDFEGAGAGVCSIWHISYSGGVTGLTVGSNVSGISGCHDISNSVTVTRTATDGGTITSPQGDNIYVCVGDGEADPISVSVAGNVGAGSQWVITDQSGIILELPSSPPFDFEGAGLGTCLIWHLSFEGVIDGVGVGFNANDITGCTDLSNPITVIRTTAEGGKLELPDGTFETTICSGDGADDIVDVVLTGEVGTSQAWVITDASGLILDLPTSEPFNFEGVPAGVCLIWNLSYEGNIGGAVIGANANNLTGCFSLSNPVTVNREEVAGGVLDTDLGTTRYVCVGDGIADPIDIDLTANVGSNSQWVITDEDGNILELPDSPPFDFEGAGLGVCLVWHLSFEDGLTGAAIGENASNLMGCYDLSNPITIVRSSAEGGSISLPDGSTDLSFCLDGTVSPIVDVVLTGNEGEHCAWVVTDATGLIIALPAGPPFDLSAVADETCVIYNICYAGDLPGLAIDWPLSGLVGCYDLSNPITVEKNIADAGTITTAFGSNITICSSDGISDVFTVINSDYTGDFSQFILADADGEILGIQSGTEFDLEGAPLGVCYVYFVAWNGPLDGDFVGSNLSALSGCYNLSNAITVNREALEGGTLTTDSGIVEMTICAGDGAPDEFGTILTGQTPAMNQTWVVLDELGNILALPTGPDFDFEGAGPGTCFLHSITYSPGMMGLLVGNNISVVTGCYALSNAIIIHREYVNGGVIDFAGGVPVIMCAGDGLPDLVDVVVTDNAGTTCQFVVTNLTGDILALPTSSPIDLDDANSEDCLIYSVCYNEPINNFAVGFNIAKWESCFDLSNSILIEKEYVDGGILTDDSGAFEIDICVGDGVPDPFTPTLTGSGNNMGQWILTDGTGTILDLPILPLDLDTGTPGVCLLYNIDFTNLTGAVIGGNTDDLAGCFDASNAFIINKIEVNAGVSSFGDGSLSVDICVGDGLPDLLDFVTSSTAAVNFTWVITDADGLILTIPTGSSFDFEGAGVGSCLVYGVSHTGNFLGEIGDNILTTTLSAGCFEVANPITVNRFDSGPACGGPAPENGPISFDVFPNPASDILNINVSTMSMDYGANIIVYDAVGRIVETQAVDKTKALQQLDITSFSDGAYFIKIESDKSSELKRFMRIRK